MKLAIVGTYPPPYGGISVHVQRMKFYLESKNIDYVIYASTARKEDKLVNTGLTKRWLCKYIFTTKEDITHFHDTGWKRWIFIGLMGFLGKKVVLTIHDGDFINQLHSESWLRRNVVRLVIRLMMKYISFIVLVNPRVKEILVSIGVNPRRMSVIPAFLPPVIRQEEVDEIPDEVWQFINKHGPIISANAFRISFYNDKDLYGIDMCIALCAKLRESYNNIGFVFCLPDIGDRKYFAELQNRIKEKDIDNNFLFITQQFQFYPILIKSDVFVRPTVIDGYGISVAEAIYLGVPAIASDVCKRPNGTILFKNCDFDDFFRKVKDVLDNYEPRKKEVQKVKLENYAECLIGVYKRLETEMRRH